MYHVNNNLVKQRANTPVIHQLEEGRGWLQDNEKKKKKSLFAGSDLNRCQIESVKAFSSAPQMSFLNPPGMTVMKSIQF